MEAEPRGAAATKVGEQDRAAALVRGDAAGACAAPNPGLGAGTAVLPAAHGAVPPSQGAPPELAAVCGPAAMTVPARTNGGTSGQAGTGRHVVTTGSAVTPPHSVTGGQGVADGLLTTSEIPVVWQPSAPPEPVVTPELPATRKPTHEFPATRKHVATRKAFAVQEPGATDEPAVTPNPVAMRKATVMDGPSAAHASSGIDAHSVTDRRCATEGQGLPAMVRAHRAGPAVSEPQERPASPIAGLRGPLFADSRAKAPGA
ncbi:MAG: hypothetical protein JOY82_10865 [Streptosporangiaceae bacterium]|nr:hypothetical protein [Streptosporangiaceae bacterium]